MTLLGRNRADRVALAGELYEQAKRAHEGLRGVRREVALCPQSDEACGGEVCIERQRFPDSKHAHEREARRVDE